MTSWSMQMLTYLQSNQDSLRIGHVLLNLTTGISKVALIEYGEIRMIYSEYMVYADLLASTEVS